MVEKSGGELNGSNRPSVRVLCICTDLSRNLDGALEESAGCVLLRTRNRGSVLAGKTLTALQGIAKMTLFRGRVEWV